MYVDPNSGGKHARAVQALSLLSPLRYYLEIGLGVFLKGVGMKVLWPQALTMG